ncbi:MAG: hypothetical protein ABI266_00050 [Ginsengibacter sp.]
MAKIKILGIGRDPVVLQKLLRFINENPGWEGTGTIDDKSAIAIFNQQKYSIVLLIDDLTKSSEENLRAEFLAKEPSVVFIKHYGDSTGLLSSELNESIQKNKIVALEEPPAEETPKK